MPPPLVLASTSPRRRRLLEEAGIPFDAVPPRNVAEDCAPGEDPLLLVQRHALAKARSVAPLFPPTLILAADTVVFLDGRIFGKPRDPAEAREMLSALQGRTHAVYTGVAILGPGNREDVGVEESAVTLRPLSREEIDAYVATGEPLDKAGAYAIQGRGALLVQEVQGDYFNVVGLPLARVARMLEAAGHSLWP